MSDSSLPNDLPVPHIAYEPSSRQDEDVDVFTSHVVHLRVQARLVQIQVGVPEIGYSGGTVLSGKLSGEEAAALCLCRLFSTFHVALLMWPPMVDE